MKKITLAVLGAGNRGKDAYGLFVERNPYEAEVVAVADTRAERRTAFAECHNILKTEVFNSWSELLAQPKLADAVIITTQDDDHFEPTKAALEKGYHVLLEKPMSNDPNECLELGKIAEKCGKIFQICHVLRYTPFFAQIKRLLTQGRIGRLITMELKENVGYWHYMHSYVRGNWRNSEQSSPMILAKSCHDMDILRWLANSAPVKVSSFGTLSYFKTANAPDGATKHCLDGCARFDNCIFNAPKFNLARRGGWPTNVVCVNQDTEAVLAALDGGQYGRCVYHCDNNVVDHQVVNLEFANEVTASFTMQAFSQDCSRIIRLAGTEGEIFGDVENNSVILNDFINGTREKVEFATLAGGHGGGDTGLMRSFLQQVRANDLSGGLTPANDSVDSHLLAFAAEQSRVSGLTVDFAKYKAGI